MLIFTLCVEGKCIEFEDIFLVSGSETEELIQLRAYYRDLFALNSGRCIIKKLHRLINGDSTKKIKLKSTAKSSYNCRSNTLEYSITEMSSKFVGCVVRKRTEDGRYEILPRYLIIRNSMRHI